VTDQPTSLLFMLSLGFMGSLHCIGMCGGLIAAISMSQPRIRWSGLFTYQIGRILTYSILGTLVGLSGMALHTFAGDLLQSLLSLLAGSLMIVFALNLAGWLPDPLSRLSNWASHKTGLAKLAHDVSNQARTRGWFTLGLANGLLPCGLVYAALSLTLASNTVFNASLMMASFGLGTIPAMMLAPSALHRLAPSLRNSAMRLAALLIIIMALITMMRAQIILSG